MPADLSKEAMLTYIKQSFCEFEQIPKKDPARRAEKCNDIFSYILIYFNHFLKNFGSNSLFKTIHQKCVEFINDPNVNRYENLVMTCLSLMDKMNVVLIENLNILNKKNDGQCNCQGCVKKMIIRHEQAGLVG